MTKKTNICGYCKVTFSTAYNREKHESNSCYLRKIAYGEVPNIGPIKPKIKPKIKVTLKVPQTNVELVTPELVTPELVTPECDQDLIPKIKITLKVPSNNIELVKHAYTQTINYDQINYNPELLTYKSETNDIFDYNHEYNSLLNDKTEHNPLPINKIEYNPLSNNKTKHNQIFDYNDEYNKYSSDDTELENKTNTYHIRYVKAYTQKEFKSMLKTCKYEFGKFHMICKLQFIKFLTTILINIQTIFRHI